VNMARMTMAPEWLIAALVWPAIAAQLFALGSSALALGLLWRHADHPLTEHTVGRLLVPWWRAFAFVNLFFFGILVIAKTAGMADVTWPLALPLIGEVLAGTHAGHVWRWQTTIALAFLAITSIPIKIRLRAGIVMTLAALLLLMDSLTSHAIDYGIVTIAIDFVHLLAGGLWAGALLGCWLINRGSHDEEASLAVPACQILSRLAFASVAVVILSGIYLVWRTIGFSLHDLIDATYSHVLGVKLLFFAVALLIGGWNRFFLIPRLNNSPLRFKLVRNVGTEAVILFAVIGLAALLANTSPPRMKMPPMASAVGRTSLRLPQSLSRR
jgi:putative copper resistance protein D